MTEYCLEINKDIADKIEYLEPYYSDGLISKEKFAQKIGEYITQYVLENDAILVKIIKRGE